MVNINCSIIIPSFNKAKFISETIKTVQNQTYGNWELIIVDDGSTDNSIEIIMGYTEMDSRISLIQRKLYPKGGSACRNIGISHASGNYVLFLDADDVLAPNCLKNRLQKIENNPENDFWVFSIGTFYQKPGDSSSVWLPKGKNFLKKFLRHDLPWHTMSVIWKKEYLEKLGGFDADYPRLQDVELHTRALLQENVKLKIFPNLKADAFYRIDNERTNLEPKRQLLNQMNGVLIYIEKITLLLNSEKNKNAIKGTLFTFLNGANYRCIVKTKDHVLHQEVWESIKVFMESQSIFSKADIHFLQFYMKLYKTGFWRIKGFNFIMKNLAIHLFNFH